MDKRIPLPTDGKKRLVSCIFQAEVLKNQAEKTTTHWAIKNNKANPLSGFIESSQQSWQSGLCKNKEDCVDAWQRKIRWRCNATRTADQSFLSAGFGHVMCPCEWKMAWLLHDLPSSAKQSHK
ncbi:hypothetical protein LH425_00135 [Laribacter hongkongensis]|uniref:hypothetical protein n=1 Tax=Laribacter hongkongensis TaxID=168471 RepID=UPI001EFE8116|nr:hypothetical protein [Laribacter hongkongensis]MCG9063462.1 hypothetical protein [Laribacter hongkongensis]